MIYSEIIWPLARQRRNQMLPTLDEIEGETLGQMLEYLSSELDSSEDSEVVRKRRSQQIDHVFCEITKVTQSAVDRYVDGILLNTIYKKAGVEAGKGG